MCVSRSAALQPAALYISTVVYNTTWFLLHLCAFGKKEEFVAYCRAATCRLIHFRSCQMGRGPSCSAVTLHPTSYCTVTLLVLCHSNEVLLCHKCSIPVQMRSQRAAVPLFDQVNSLSWEQFTVYYKYQVLSYGWQWHFWCRLKQRDIALLLLQPAGLDNALWTNLFTLFTIKRKEAKGKM